MLQGLGASFSKQEERFFRIYFVDPKNFLPASLAEGLTYLRCPGASEFSRRGVFEGGLFKGGLIRGFTVLCGLLRDAGKKAGQGGPTGAKGHLLP